MLPLLVVDAFTDEPFRGNPAAVCVLPAAGATVAWPADAWMLAVADELKHSETAFVRGHGEGADGTDWDLRWFTPAVEVDLCGHATLATAHALRTEGYADPVAELRFHTRSGVLGARAVADRIELDFPAVAAVPRTAPPALAPALGAEPVAAFDIGHSLLAELADAATVRALVPDIAAVATLEAHAVVVTAASDDPRFDFVSRTFGPRVGIDEDPVTGSSHCALAPFWAARIGRNEVVGRQVSARGGTVHCTVVSGDGGNRVLLAGTAVTIARGTLQV